MSGKLLVLPVAIVAFAGYFVTLCPTVFAGDPGDLSTAAYTLGIAHPSGYPLYTVIGYLFSHLLPIGNPAFRLNLLSALAGTAGVVFTQLTIRRLLPREDGGWLYDAAPALAALGLAFSQMYWSQAVIGEVNSMHFAFCGAFIYCLTSWALEKRLRFLYAAAILGGLGMSTHMSLGIFGPGTLLLIGMTAPRIYRFKGANALSTEESVPSKKSLPVFIMLAILFVGSLFPYLYMYMRAQMDPVYNWGDIDSFTALLNHILTRHYFTNWGVSAAQFGQFLAQTLWFLFTQIHWLALPALFGFWIIGKKSRALGVFFLLSVALFVCFTGMMDRNNSMLVEIDVYAVPALMILFAAAGVCLGEIGDRLSRGGQRAVLDVVMTISVFMGAVALPLVINRSLCDRSQNYIALDYANNLLLTADPKLSSKPPILLVNDDTADFASAYIQLVDRQMTDRIVINIVKLNQWWYQRQLLRRHGADLGLTEPFFPQKNEALAKAEWQNRDINIKTKTPAEIEINWREHKQIVAFRSILDANLGKRLIVSSSNKIPFSDPKTITPYKMFPFGVAYRLIPYNEEPPHPEELRKQFYTFYQQTYRLRGLNESIAPPDDRYSNPILMAYMAGFVNTASYCLDKNDCNGAQNLIMYYLDSRTSRVSMRHPAPYLLMASVHLREQRLKNANREPFNSQHLDAVKSNLESAAKEISDMKKKTGGDSPYLKEYETGIGNMQKARWEAYLEKARENVEKFRLFGPSSNPELLKTADEYSKLVLGEAPEGDQFKTDARNIQEAVQVLLHPIPGKNP